MQKVVYSITKLGRFGDDFKFSGLGFIKDNNLITKTKSGKFYVYDDCLNYCYPILGKPNEFKGTYYEFKEIEVEDDKGRNNTIEVEVNYKIWFKII